MGSLDINIVNDNVLSYVGFLSCLFLFTVGPGGAIVSFVLAPTDCLSFLWFSPLAFTLALSSFVQQRHYKHNSQLERPDL